MTLLSRLRAWWRWPSARARWERERDAWHFVNVTVTKGGVSLAVDGVTWAYSAMRDHGTVCGPGDRYQPAERCVIG